MLLKDITLDTPEENILYDEVLLSLAEEGSLDETLRLWEAKEYFMVLGKISREQDDLRAERMIKDGIPAFRRCSGGGTVLQGPGCLNYSLILNKESQQALADISKSYRFILEKVMRALSLKTVPLVFMPISDIAMQKNNLKVSGNAQKRLKRFILHHGTLLYDFDLRLIEKYLKMPKAVPEYRQGRSHKDFVGNLPVEREMLKSLLCEGFAAKKDNSVMTVQEAQRLKMLLRSKNIRVNLT